MAVNKVDLYVSQILEDLNNGLTWLKRDDIGYGSIQDKYNAKDQQIAMIRKHPALKDAETNITVFNIIDDTKDERSTTVPNRERSETTESVERIFSSETDSPREARGTVQQHQTDDGQASVGTEDELSAFINL